MTPDRWMFQRPRAGRIGFSPGAQGVLLGYRQLRETDPEAGGVLIGRLIRGTEDVIVDLATSPGLRDVRKRHGFVRAREDAQAAIDAAWHASTATSVYLGEWHSHPEDHPSPSHHDLADWNRTVRTASFEQGFLFFVIVGRVSSGCWEIAKTNGRAQELVPSGTPRPPSPEPSVT